MGKGITFMMAIAEWVAAQSPFDVIGIVPVSAVLFFSAALPKQVFPPLFNRYREGMTFSSHVDGAIRTHEPSRQRIRTDLSATLFLSSPDEYDGGELLIEDTYGIQRVKLESG